MGAVEEEEKEEEEDELEEDSVRRNMPKIPCSIPAPDSMPPPPAPCVELWDAGAADLVVPACSREEDEEGAGAAAKEGARAGFF